MSYVIERTPGIAAVRNRALDESPDADAVVFLDDDELPEPDWLRNLVEMHRTTKAHAVAGRVITRFPDDVEPWVAAQRGVHPTGARARPVDARGRHEQPAADLTQIRPLALRFDERFGLTGGSDSMFTRALTARGGTIRWAENAVVLEQEEAARFTRSWVLMRAFRFGNTAARVDIALAGSAGARAGVRVRTSARGAARVAGGSARCAWGVLTRSLPRRARGLRTAYRGAGMIAASIGYAHDEYGRRRRWG